MSPGYKREKTVTDEAGVGKAGFTAGIQTQVRKIQNGKTQRGRRKKEKWAPDNVWQGNVEEESRNRMESVVKLNMGRQGQRMRRAQWIGSCGGRGPRERKGDSTGPGLGGQGGGKRGILTLALVRLALALGRRVGLTASAIDPTASSASPLVFVKFLLFPTTYPVPPPDCHMIKSPPLPEKGRQLGASTVCIRGQTTPESFSPEGSGPHLLPSRPRPRTRVHWTSRLRAGQEGEGAGANHETDRWRHFQLRYTRTSQPHGLKGIRGEVVVNLVFITRSSQPKSLVCAQGKESLSFRV